MTRDQIIEVMQAQGFTHVITYGGPLPLNEWHPYNSPTWKGEIIPGDRVRDLPRNGELMDGFYLGVWSFTRES